MAKVICKKCGAPGLFWKQNKKGAWYLAFFVKYANRATMPHKCNSWDIERMAK